MTSPRIGIQLPSVDALGTGRFEIVDSARDAEALGFDCAWVGDHLSFHAPVIESFVAAAAAAAVTTTLTIGFGVLIGPLRHPVWLAKQMTSLQALSGGRVEFGIGVGGEFAGEWDAVGVPRTERGRRMDALLDALPSLTSGTSTRLGPPWNADVPPLEPHFGLPRLWIGGRSEIAIRRAARVGAGWVGTWVDSTRVRRAVDILAELSADAPPPIAVQVLVNPATDRAEARDELARYLNGIYRMPFEQVERYTLAGSTDDLAAGVRELLDAGASTVVLIPGCANPLDALPRLAGVAEAVRND